MANAFNPQGRVKYLFVEDIADPAAPTVGELEDAGVLDLTCSILTDGVAGFSREPQNIDATPLCATAEQTVPGLSTTTNGAITMFRASDAADTGSVLLDDLIDLVGTEGYVVAVLEGEVETGALVDVFPSEIASVNAQPLVGGQTARYIVGFSHYADFSLNSVVVAS